MKYYVTVDGVTHQLDFGELQTAATGVSTKDISDLTSQTKSTVRTNEADGRRIQARLATAEAAGDLQDAYMQEWQLRTRQRTELAVKTLLDDVADLGFAWRDIARLVGVSVPAVQKWRKGGSSSSENRLRLGQLLAGCDLLMEHRPLEDIGQWFEVPLVAGTPISPIDLWADGLYELVFEYALKHVDAEVILSLYDTDWRERYSSDFETFVAGDGQLSIRSRER